MKAKGPNRIGVAVFVASLLVQLFLLDYQTRFWWLFSPGAYVVDRLFPGSIEGLLGYGSVVLVLVFNAVLYAAVVVFIVRRARGRP